MKEGYIPIFLRFEYQKPNFYYIKPTSNLKSLLKLTFGVNKSYRFWIKFIFYNNGRTLDGNISINKLNLNLLSVIDVVK